MRSEKIESLELLSSRLGINISKKRELLNGYQMSLNSNGNIVHATIYNNGNYLIQGKESQLKDIIEKWANKKKEGLPYGCPDYGSAWREWDEDAKILEDFIKKHGEPDEENAPHNYKIHREIMFHDFMFRNSSSNIISFKKIEFVVRSWTRRFCFMNLEIDNILYEIKKIIANYDVKDENQIDFGVAVDAIANAFSDYCPHKFVNLEDNSYCPQVKSGHFDCLSDLIDSLFIYCENQHVLAYNKLNFRKLVYREKGELKWHNIAPASPIEERMFEGLNNAGLLTLPQFQAYSPEHKYRIDYVIKTSNGLSLAIECDGLQFHANANTYMRDRIRDRYLQQRGFHVMRFSSIEIFNQLEKCVKEIDEAFWMIQKGKLTLNTKQRIGYFGLLDEQ